MNFTILRVLFVLFSLSLQAMYLQASDDYSMRKPLLAAESGYHVPTAPSTAMMAGRRQDVLRIVSFSDCALLSQEAAFSVAAIESGEVTSSSLLEGLNGLSVNATNEVGETLLVQACRLNCLPAVELCCRIGVAINLPDNHGNTPLTAACEHSGRANEELIRTLLTHGAEINGIAVRFKEGSSTPIRSWPRQTPLYMMARTNKVALVTTMIAEGALFGFFSGGKYVKGAGAYDKFMQVTSMTAMMRELLDRNAAALSPSCCCMQ